MGDIISKIYDDMQDYEDLCKYFDEPCQYEMDAYNNRQLACYGKHANELEKRMRDIREGKAEAPKKKEKPKKMKVTKNKVKTYVLKPMCSCGTEMDKSPFVKTSNPPIYTYRCSDCGYEEESRENLPRTIYEVKK